MVLSEPVARNSMYYCTILVILRSRFGGILLNSTPFHQIPPILGYFQEKHMNWRNLGVWGGKYPFRVPGDENSIDLEKDPGETKNLINDSNY